MAKCSGLKFYPRENSWGRARPNTDGAAVSEWKREKDVLFRRAGEFDITVSGYRRGCSPAREIMGLRSAERLCTTCTVHRAIRRCALRCALLSFFWSFWRIIRKSDWKQVWWREQKIVFYVRTDVLLKKKKNKAFCCARGNFFSGKEWTRCSCLPPKSDKLIICVVVCFSFLFRVYNIWRVK